MKKVSKNILTVLTFLILISFTASSISLSELISTSCKANTGSCCCKVHSEKTAISESIQKQCCCEISQNTNQPLEINNLFVPESIKVQNCLVKINYDFNYFKNFNKSANSSYTIISFHSLPENDICISNSILRI